MSVTLCLCQFWPRGSVLPMSTSYICIKVCKNTQPQKSQNEGEEKTPSRRFVPKPNSISRRPSGAGRRPAMAQRENGSDWKKWEWWHSCVGRLSLCQWKSLSATLRHHLLDGCFIFNSLLTSYLHFCFFKQSEACEKFPSRNTFIFSLYEQYFKLKHVRPSWLSSAAREISVIPGWGLVHRGDIVIIDMSAPALYVWNFTLAFLQRLQNNFPATDEDGTWEGVPSAASMSPNPNNSK